MVNFTGYSKKFPLLIDILTKGKSLKKFEDGRYVFLDNDKKKKKKVKRGKIYYRRHCSIRVYF